MSPPTTRRGRASGMGEAGTRPRRRRASAATGTRAHPGARTWTRRWRGRSGSTSPSPRRWTYSRPCSTGAARTTARRGRRGTDASARTTARSRWTSRSAWPSSSLSRTRRRQPSCRRSGGPTTRRCATPPKRWDGRGEGTGVGTERKRARSAGPRSCTSRRDLPTMCRTAPTDGRSSAT